MSQYTIEQERRDGVEIFSLRDGETAVARVAPALGNNCFSFAASGDILEPIPFAEFLAKPTAYGIPILFPFPNRIRDGRFEFGGRTYEVNPPRHGFVRDKSWEVVDASAAALDGAWIHCRFDSAAFAEQIHSCFPFPFTVDVTYRLRDQRLVMETSARNQGDAVMPLGFGIHPYFRRPARGTILVPAARRWELEDSIPVGTLTDVSGRFDLRHGASTVGLELDDVFTSLATDQRGLVRCCIQDLDDGLTTNVEFQAADFPHVVVYLPPAPRQAVCIEPLTCPTDGFNLQARGIESNVISLAPGEAMNVSLAIWQSVV